MDLIASKQNALYQIALNQIGQNWFELFMPAEWHPIELREIALHEICRCIKLN